MQTKIDRALEVLGIRNFLLGIHDAAFPSLPEENLGRGSPYSAGAAGFLGFIRSLGFNGVQLGPQGITSPANSSPYDGSFFSKSPLSLAPLALTGSNCNLLDPEILAGFTAQHHCDTSRVDGVFARLAIENISDEVCSRYRREMRGGESSSCATIYKAFVEFRRQNAAWLQRDALYQLLRLHYGGKTWRHWGAGEEAIRDRDLFGPRAAGKEPARLRLLALHRQHAQAVENYSFIQFLLAEQHWELRERCRDLGLKLFGDFQIGLSSRDAWYAQSFLLQDYVMGAPPSRTNPEGQPWNYPVLDPGRYFVDCSKGKKHPGPAARFLRQRVEKLVAEFDGLRLDHPHGLVCPWVYRAYQDDPFEAVQNGARLFSSPSAPDHPALIKYAIAGQDQLNKGRKRYDDDWVTDLDQDQVNRYAQLFAVIMDTVKEKWGSFETIACEILSTQPYPLKRVMEMYGLGRFRVTQKADLTNTRDVYRSENAQPEDWMMLGNHDTAPIWQVADRWLREGISRSQAEYLAGRLRIPEAERTKWLERLAVDPAALVQAKFADLFVGPAKNVMVFFTDLLGNKETYNKPGTVSEKNWTLRIPPNYKKLYSEKLLDNLALNIPKALALALRAKSGSIRSDCFGLIRELE